tara:strand:- start:104 stop:991 length:888 start_codon:yes stop_codon:yes gene_type:complete
MYENIKKIKLNDRIIIELIGTDTKDFLQALVTNNINLISYKKSIYAALLSPQGKYIFDFFIFENSINGLISIDCASNRYEELLKILNMYKLRNKIVFNINKNVCVLGIYGSNYSELLLDIDMNYLEGNTKKINNTIVIIDPRNKNLGLRIYSNIACDIEKFDHIPNGTLAEFDYNRLQLKVPNPEIDLEIEKSFLIENNFESLNAIDFNKGCYIGQENTARQKYRGTAKKKLVLVRIYGQNILNGTKIYVNEKIIGTMRSSCKDLGLVTIKTAIYEEYKNNKLTIKTLKSEIELL